MMMILLLLLMMMMIMKMMMVTMMMMVINKKQYKLVYFLFPAFDETVPSSPTVLLPLVRGPDSTIIFKRVQI